MRFLKFIYNAILDSFFPANCYSCDINDDYLCDPCATNLVPKQIQICIVCGKLSMDGFTHPKCQTKYLPDRLITMFDYHDFPIKQLITAGKYYFVPRIFQKLGKLLAIHLLIPKYAVVTSIPLHWKRQNWRGFNQSELLASEVNQFQSINYQALLTRTKLKKQQNGLAKPERGQNIKDVFRSISTQSPLELVLIIDDVCTTGSTFIEACRTIKKAHKNARVWCVAVAQD